MFLEFTAFTRDGQWRDFSCQVDQLEVGLDVLHSITKMGDQLVNAYLVDGGSRLPLPVEAIDGDSFTEPIGQLKRDWEQLLAEPLPPTQFPPINWRQTEIIEPILALKQQRIDTTRNTLNKLQMLLRTTELTMRDGPHKVKLTSHYKAIIKRYLYSLSKLENDYFIPFSHAQ